MPETVATASDGAKSNSGLDFAISPACENNIGITVEKPIPIASQPKITPPTPPTIKPEANPIPAINPPPIINFIGPNFAANRSPMRRPITIAAEKQM